MPAVSDVEKSTPFIFFISIMYLTLNTSLNMLNRWALGQYNFHFPMILTACKLLLRRI